MWIIENDNYYVGRYFNEGDPTVFYKSKPFKFETKEEALTWLNNQPYSDLTENDIKEKD